MAPVAQIFLALTVVMLAARATGSLMIRIGQPRVVGEILAGVLIGPSALGRLGGPVATDRLFGPDAQAALAILGQVGLVLYMMVVGVRFDPASLRGMWRSVSLVAIAVIAAPVLGGFALVPFMFGDRFALSESPIAFGLFLGAMLSVSAFPVMVRILEERDLHHSTFGSVAIGAAAAVTVMMFALAGLSTALADTADAIDLIRLPVQVVAYLVGMLLILKPVLARFANRIAALPPSGVLGLAVTVSFTSGLLAVQAGVGVIVGGFIAGLVLPSREVLGSTLAHQLGDIVTVSLLPIFLASSGLVTNLGAVDLGSLPGLGALLLMAVFTKWTVGWGAARAVGLAPKEANALGILLNCRGLLILVVALNGLQAGVITPALQFGAVLIALVTTAMTGPMFRRALPDRRPDYSVITIP
jgi:Kef-type K+ transport system membrane component KefB